MSDEGRPQPDAGPVYATTRHGRLSLEQMAGLMPGLGTLMPVIADRFGWMVHAGRGGNWRLATYQLRKVRKLFGMGKTTRPRWTETIDAYVEGSLEPIRAAIEERDVDAFEAAVAAAVEEANRIHGNTGYGYIRYRVPDSPPEHMELGPDEEREDA